MGSEKIQPNLRPPFQNTKEYKNLIEPTAVELY